MKKVIILDRDGVINKKQPPQEYVKAWEEFSFIAGAIEALALLKKNKYKVFVVTNQRGVARGHMSAKDLEAIHDHMQQVLRQHEAEVDGIYVCMHNYSDACACRKPRPGLLFQAAKEQNFLIEDAIFIGDTITDLEAGNAAGCKTIILESGQTLYDVVSILVQ